MIDCTTKKPLRVSTEGGAGSYIALPVSQLEEVQRLLERHTIRHWVKENFISLNGGPYEAVIKLDRSADPTAVQAILDSIL
jgi:hypothetical protein